MEAQILPITCGVIAVGAVEPPHQRLNPFCTEPVFAAEYRCDYGGTQQMSEPNSPNSVPDIMHEKFTWSGLTTYANVLFWPETPKYYTIMYKCKHSQDFDITCSGQHFKNKT